MWGNQGELKLSHTHFLQPFAPYVFPFCYGHSPNGGFNPSGHSYLPQPHLKPSPTVVLSASSSLPHKGFLPPSKKKHRLFHTSQPAVEISEVRKIVSHWNIGISLWHTIHRLSVHSPSCNHILDLNQFSLFTIMKVYTLGPQCPSPIPKPKITNTSSMGGNSPWLLVNHPGKRVFTWDPRS